MHDVRVAYLVLREKPIMESEFLRFAGAGCPITGRPAPTGKPEYPMVWFGRMFPPSRTEGLSEGQLLDIANCLIKLGRCMDDPVMYFTGKPGNASQVESDIPAGYTYLGQFITHEITFDNAKELPLVASEADNIRSPSLDLDSLYGAGPNDPKSKELYVAASYPARLKVGWTQPPLLPDSSWHSKYNLEFPNDLPRKTRGDRMERGVAIIGDERNDENLPLAQTHVAFLKFHNRVVEDLAGGRYKNFGRDDFLAPPAPEELFEAAKEEVVKHFQWIVLKDYLPRIVDKDFVESLIRKPSGIFNLIDGQLFIPLEFSAAAFRIGHSMVRREYVWNREQKVAALFQLFNNTKQSGDLGGLDRLDSTWVIDWKNFYDFTPFADDYPYDPPKGFNKAGKIDTTLDLHLDLINGFHHLQPHVENNGDGGTPGNHFFNDQKALPVRNLLRGLSLGLPCGEDVADELKGKGFLTEEQRLKPSDLSVEPYASLLADQALGGKTPLWFYVLREAQVKGNGCRLGRVGGRIVAETLIGLIRHSRYSILMPVKGSEPDGPVEGEESEWMLSEWRPAYGRIPDVPEGVKFEMVDLLRAADVVDPLGEHKFKKESPQT